MKQEANFYSQLKIKNSEIPILENYEKDPGEWFWKEFPSKQLPSVPESSIDSDKLLSELEGVKDRITHAEYTRGLRAIESIKEGAPSHQKSSLPGCFVENSSSTTKHGREVSDNIATWVKNNYAAGPFRTPPLSEFRVNPLLAVVQPGKIRPVLDVSRPEGKSYNCNVDENKMEKIKMTSAKIFGNKLLEAGENAIFSKSDLVAAYKQVPCKLSDLKNQGFCWLGRYFVETRQVFGAKTSVANFDNVGETLQVIALAKTGLHRNTSIRQLDDLVIVAPFSKNWCQMLTKEYKILCKNVGVELAENCEKCEKAFENKQRGKVLGVLFDSTDLTWALPEEKIEKCLKKIKEILESATVSLKNYQKTMGRINDICQMCPF